MKTFDISKNIILAFIILISIALKLSAHENTTLIGSANVPIEKGKNEENISKRNVQNKTILCYERNKWNIWKDIFVSLGSAILGTLSTLAGTFYWSKRTEKSTKKYHKETLKIELEGNLNALNKKFKNFQFLEKISERDFSFAQYKDMYEYRNDESKLKEKFNNELNESLKQIKDIVNIIENDFYIHLSDFSWNQFKYVISDLNENSIKSICEAYTLVGEINNSVNASVHKSSDKIVPALLMEITKAIKSLKEANKALKIY